MDFLFDELEKMRKRKAINAKISKIRNKIKELELYIQEYQNGKTLIDEQVELWNNQYQLYGSLDLVTDINITDSFEGVSADYFAAALPPTVEDINTKANKMTEISSGITVQIMLIREYIGKLNREIQILLQELAAI